MNKSYLFSLGFFAFSLAAIALPGDANNSYQMNWNSCPSKMSQEIYLAKSLPQTEREIADLSENEIPFPDEELWVEHDGLEYQLTTSTPVVLTTAKSFVYCIWIRNPDEATKSLRVISHPKLLTHFDLMIISEDGESMLVGQCRKKHDYKTIEFATGQLRGFRLDAFEGWCRRLESLPENPSSFTLAYHGAKLRVQTKLRQDQAE